jgi:two-component system invasion response regulator UvrY
MHTPSSTHAAPSGNATRHAGDVPSPSAPPQRTLRLLVADDHAVVRRGLRQIVEEFPDLRVQGEAGTSDEVIACIKQDAYDAVILDLNMPGPGGLAVLRSIKNHCPSLPVLILTMHAEAQYATRMLKAGAAGFLQKESAPEELVQAIRRICDGLRYFKPGQAEELILSVDRPPEQAPHTSLSDREFEVLRRLASGRTVSQVATDLNLSVKTVSTYRTRLLEKMRMKTNAELTHYAIKNRLVE